MEHNVQIMMIAIYNARCQKDCLGACVALAYQSESYFSKKNPSVKHFFKKMKIFRKFAQICVLVSFSSVDTPSRFGNMGLLLMMWQNSSAVFWVSYRAL